MNPQSTRRAPRFHLLLLLAALACRLSSWRELTTSSGGVLYQDDFSDRLSGWDRLGAEVGIMDYDGGGYRMLISAPDLNLWATPKQDFADVRIEVDAAKLAGPDENRFGLICRFQAGQYYFFVISSDGYYGVGIFAGGRVTLLGQSQMQYAQAVRTGLAVNHLRADCVGDTLTFYVNGAPVAMTHDASLTAGDVGLLVGAFDQPGVDVVFDNFVVYKP